MAPRAIKRLAWPCLASVGVLLAWLAYLPRPHVSDWLMELLLLFDRCPPVHLRRAIAVLAVGDNYTSAITHTVEPAHQPLYPPWRPLLAVELKRSAEDTVIFDAAGRELHCLASVPLGTGTGNGVYVYVAPAGTLWQWPAEHVGFARAVRLPPLRFDADRPEGTWEAAWEPAARSSIDNVARGSAATDDGTDTVMLQTLSTSPPIFRAPGLLTEAALDALLAAAAPGLARSTVGDPTQTQAPYRQVDERRTSLSAWIHGYNDPRHSHSVARAVQRRVAALLALPSERLWRGIEPLLAVEYPEGTFYEPHFDFFGGGGGSDKLSEPAFTPPHGSNRFATVIVYLTSAGEPGDGGFVNGHTVFPFAGFVNGSDSLDGVAFAGAVPGAPACSFPAPSTPKAARGMLVQPRRGDAILFYDQRPDGSLDGRARHGSCPVVRGTKRVINVWAWNRDVIYR